MEFQSDPRRIPAGEEVTLSFRILDPVTSQPVTKFNEVHEKLFHLFLVSYDLEYFSHKTSCFRARWVVPAKDALT